MNAATLLWLGGAMVIFLTATSVMRAYVDRAEVWLIMVALSLYCVGNLMMVRVMRDGGLAVAVAVSSVLQLVLAALVAVALFSERPTPLQWSGIALGVIAVALIAWPQGGRG